MSFSLDRFCGKLYGLGFREIIIRDENEKLFKNKKLDDLTISIELDYTDNGLYNWYAYIGENKMECLSIEEVKKYIKTIHIKNIRNKKISKLLD